MSFSFAVCRPSPGRVFERIIALFGLIVLIPASFAPSAYATAVGATPGSHQVSPSGAFTYTIPIAVPPGTAGIEPKLSLSYNSQGGNGLLGMGWSLAGLSVIHRCPKTMVQDGVIGGVNYNANDRYCLDGQRLVAVSGTYGADATEYRTESESYSRIVSYGSQGSGPAWWKGWTKSGQILEYGNTADSRIEAQGKSEVMLWSLNKLADTVGNTLTVSYIEDTPNGQFYPDRIDYTGNASAGKTPTNSVRFVYEVRPDITPLYQAGSVNKTMVRLTNVQTFVGNTVFVKTYQLAYEQSLSSQRTRLTKITECVDGKCLQGTSLFWVGNTTVTFQSSSILGPWCDQPVQVDDFNGDGKTDRFCKDGGNRNYVGLSNGDGTFGETFPLGPWCDQPVQFGDFNGDGKTDRFCKDSGNRNSVGLSNGDGTFGETFPLGLWCDQPVQFGDFNGDGKTDRFCKDGGNRNYVGLSNGDGTFGETFPLGPWCDQPVQFGDFNGDGKTDRFCKDGGNNNNVSLVANGLTDYLGAITNGLGTTTTLTYKPLTDSSVYTKASGAVYPYVDIQSPLYVVSSVATSDGIGGTYSTYYSYAGAKSHLLGGGFLGFRQVSAHDPQAHIRSTTTYRQDYPYQGQPLSTQKLTDSGVLLGQSLITYTDQLLNTGISPTWHQSLPTHTVESSYELTGGLISTVVTDTQYDTWGNPTAIAVDSGGGYNKTTTNTYDNIIDANRWFLGRLRRSAVTSVTP